MTAIGAALVVDAVLADRLTAKVVGDLLVGTATLIGGFLTVAFALSVSLQQSVADLYSPQHLADYSYRTRQRVSFAAIAGSVFACLALGLYCQSIETFATRAMRTTCVVVGFGVVGVALAVIETQLHESAQRLRPITVIEFLRRQAEEHLKTLDHEARRLAKRLLLDQQGTVEEATAWAYRRLADTTGPVVVHHLSRLQEMALRLSNRGDSVAAGHALAAWGLVFRVYLQNRQDCSLLVPTDMVLAGPESDSAWIVNRAMEQLNDLGGRFLHNKQGQNARHVVRLYGELANQAATIRFVNGQAENPIVDQLGWYLKSHVEAAAGVGDVDVPFAAIAVFTAMGKKGIETGSAHAPYSTCAQLDVIVDVLARADRTVFLERCVTACAELLLSLLAAENMAMNFQPIVNSMERTHGILQRLAGDPSIRPASHLWTAIRAPFDHTQAVVQDFVRWFQQQPRKRQRELRGRFQEFSDDLYHFIRRSSETVTARSGYADLLSDLIFDMVRALAATYDEPFDHSLEHAHKWLYLLTWIAHKEKPLADAAPVLKAAETAARAALFFTKKEATKELVLAATDALRSIAQRVIEYHLPSYGYDEPRSIAPMFYVAAVALKKGDAGLFTAAVDTLRRLEDQYEEKFRGSTKDGRRVAPPTSVVRELLAHDRKSFLEQDPCVGAVQPLIGEAQHLLSLADFDLAIWRIWSVMPKWSPIEKELRKSYYRELVRVLRAKLDEHQQPV